MIEPIKTLSIRDYVDFSNPKWSAFTFIESRKAYEVYIDSSESHDCAIDVKNESYVIVCSSIEQTLIEFKDLLENLRCVSLCLKTICHDVNEGRLIFQSRTSVKIYEREDGRFQLHWRGKLDRILIYCDAISIDFKMSQRVAKNGN